MALASYFLLCLALTSSCEAYKALVIYGMPSKSHSILGAALVKHLLKEGHEVTYVTSVPYDNPPSNLRQVDVSKNFELLPNEMISIKNLMDKQMDFSNHKSLRSIMLGYVESTLKNENFQKVLNDPKEHFDVVIVEWMFSEVMSGLAQVYDCPLIWMAPVEIFSQVIGLVDAAPGPAYSADASSIDMPPFTFQQRVEQLWSRIKVKYLEVTVIDGLETDVYERLIAPVVRKRGRVPLAYSEVRYNASLVLGNSHVSMGQAYSLPQNYKVIGGYHVAEEIQPLPEDLKKIMDNAKNGVIYFSMGSILKSKDWPDDVKQNILKMFGELKQTVLWKFEEDLPNVPKNVHILKWAPQPAILSHPKCVLFITHGGLLSLTETIHYGVPIIGIPAFGDQFLNIKKAEAKGFGLGLRLSYNMAEDMKTTINEILQNPKYRLKVKELSFIYHDRPVKPAVEMLHWIRHVVQLRGAPHLRSPAADVPLYQRLYLDLLALVLVVLLIAMVVLSKLFALLLSKKNLASKSDSKKSKKKNN